MWKSFGLLLFLSFAAPVEAAEIRVRDAHGFRDAVRTATAGTTVLLSPGAYEGSFGFSDLKGTAAKPIIIKGADSGNPPKILGPVQLSEISHVRLEDLVFRGSKGNGLNIDDGGTYDTPSHHITLRNLRVLDTGSGGNQDGIKLSGIDDFLLENVTVENWSKGGAGVDMVGCHRGRFLGCRFKGGGDTGIQAKGGTSDILIRGCRFEDYGGRGINLGGSTGMQFFRPPIATMPPSAKYEAKDIRVEHCVFVGGTAPFAFVGVDGAVVRRNTIYRPGRWAFRILQETRDTGFVPSRNGVFEENIIVFRSDSWASGGVNVGDGTAPQTFKFARNWWYCEDQPARSRPQLPTPESGGVYGENPRLRNPEAGDFTLLPNSPARARGAKPTSRST